MELTTLVFYFFATILILASLGVITSRNPVHAVMYLVLVFFSAGGIWIIMGAEFLAIVLVFAYVGAVMVLFLFVIMMLDINLDRLRERFWQYLPLGAAVALLVAVEVGFILWLTFSRYTENLIKPLAADHSNVKAVGRLLFTEYVYPFELASVILFLGIIAAITLTMRGKRKKNKAVNPAQQIVVKAKDRIRVLKIAAEKED